MLNHGASALLAASESGPLLALLVVAVGGVALVLCLLAMKKLTGRCTPHRCRANQDAGSGDAVLVSGYLSGSGGTVPSSAKGSALPASAGRADAWDCNDGGFGGDGGGSDGGGGGGD